MSENNREWTDPGPLEEDSREWIQEHWDEIYERDRGVLSDADRRFMAGVADLGSSQSRSNARRRIRSRVRESILDAEYLLELDEKQLLKIRESFDDPLLMDYRVSQWLALLFRLLDRDLPRFENRIELAVRAAGELDPEQRKVPPEEGGGYQYIWGDVDVDIDIKYTQHIDDVQEIYEERGPGALTPTQIGMLAQHGRLDAEDLEQLERDPPEEDPRHMRELREQGLVD